MSATCPACNEPLPFAPGLCPSMTGAANVYDEENEDDDDDSYEYDASCDKLRQNITLMFSNTIGYLSNENS
ncbi:hypothetical protein PHISCL_03434 [Aspergillus sclerotialis]|uniref:Uncharacterized protein n=1 Tax=Aspergillus sclerotialis TaxID=2070753 RepID=A0A3A2ZY24_9EURO|nr:hypothetical protein PHISCL_03434 [Aspergillus sclerotialis]